MLIIRQIEDRDYKAFEGLFDEAYDEYLEFLKHESPEQYLRELEERMLKKVTRQRFDFYFKAGSSFVAEEDGEVVGYVASQTINFMHGVDKVLWIEYIVVQKRFRKKGIGLVLLQKLIDHAKAIGINRIRTTINPDNEASIGLHLKAGFNVRDWKTASYRVW